jgi:hypothetical protein
MLNLPSNVTLKSFIEICKAYGLDQDSKYIKVKDHTLNLEAVKIELHILEIIEVKEETQELLKHKFELIIMKEKTKIEYVKEQKSNVQIRRFAID